MHPSSPLVEAQWFNRLSGPDANSRAACHNAPFGAPGSSGDFVGGAFVVEQGFDFVDFDTADMTPLRGRIDATGRLVALDDFANFRASIGTYGSSYVERLARHGLQLRRERDHRTHCQQHCMLGGAKPDLVLKSFREAAAVTILRQLSNNAINHHHGNQSIERFGAADVDGDGFAAEMTTSDVAAITLFQMTCPFPVVSSRRMPQSSPRFARGRSSACRPAAPRASFRSRRSARACSASPELLQPSRQPRSRPRLRRPARRLMGQPQSRRPAQAAARIEWRCDARPGLHGPQAARHPRRSE